MIRLSPFIKRSLTIVCVAFVIAQLCGLCQADEIVGDVRVQVLSPTLVRVELEGPKGFEDRPTFHVTERDWLGASVARHTTDGYDVIQTSNFDLKVPSGAQSLDGIVVTDSSGNQLWSMPSAAVMIRCAWDGDGDAYLFDDGDRVGYSDNPADDRYYWVLENANGFTQIRNKATGDYMNLENNLDYVECTPAEADWASKDWGFEDAWDGHQRLRCSWLGMEHYMHIEGLKGYVEHAPAGTDNGNSTIDAWWSALWVIEGEATDLFSNNRHWLPNPSDNTQAWAFADTPRYVPGLASASWGGGYNLAPWGTSNNGWDLANDSHDVYIFLPNGDGQQLRSDFIRLTGRTDLIPLYALGAWDSRFYAYTQQEALAKIDTYRSKDIPLDMFVIDTDWRVGASHGYAVNTDLFPNMPQFIEDAHNKNVRIMFNDHPEPQADALDYVEVQYRNNGLRELFDMGLDVWWYDRNWHTEIIPPDGLNKEVFGMYIYRWVTQDHYPDRRPLIMANVDGIDNGWLNRAPNVAAHRYNLQWTGDTSCDDVSLQREVRNMIHNGAFGPFAYTSTDVGGFIGKPTLEQYCRWIQYGAMSPIFRLHCIIGETRNPWDFPDPAEDVVRDYLKMRMRLLPVFYAAARRNYDTGEPILKRCDLQYPGYSEAVRDDQYLLGDDILVAPIVRSSSKLVAADWLQNNGSAGLKGEYFANRDLWGSPTLTRTDANIDFDWGYNSPGDNMPVDDFSIEWTGEITIDAGYDVLLGLSTDDGCRLWVNNELVIDRWAPQGQLAHWTDAVFQNGKTYSIKVQYFEAAGVAACQLLYQDAGEPRAKRELWIPPGTWKNVWTGNRVTGPRQYMTSVAMTEMPLFVKEGSIVPLAPDMEYTSEKAWDPITLDVYPGTETAIANLYEDDGISNDYTSGGYRNTSLEAVTSETTKTVSVYVHPAQGTYDGALSTRSWKLRLHHPTGWPASPNRVTVDGLEVPFSIVSRDSTAAPFNMGGAADGDTVEVAIASAPVSMKRKIAVYYYSPADYNQDGSVEINDLQVILDNWLMQPGDLDYDGRANLNQDSSGKIDLSDFAIFCREWLRSS